MRTLESSLEARIPNLVASWRARLAPGPGTPRASSQALSPKEIEAVGASLLRLQRGLTGGRALPGSGYMDSPDLLGAYLLYYWPVSYLQVSLALAWLARRLGGLPPLGRVLDLGAGPGPATAALLDAGARRADLLDSSAQALDLAKDLLGGQGPAALDLRTATVDLESLEELPDHTNYDLIVACHSLNEVWKAEDEAPRRAKRQALLGRVAERLAPSGILLLLEPSLLGTSRDLLALRDGLTGPGSGLAVLGPCVRQGPCPALAAGPNQTCHAETPWEAPEPLASLAAAAGLDRSSIKTTWIALARRDSPLFAAATPEAGAEAEALALVVSEAMLNKAGRVRYLLCSEAGRFPLSAKRDDPAARAQGFFGLGRYDLVGIASPERRGSPESGPAWGMGQLTRLELLAPAPGVHGEALG